MGVSNDYNVNLPTGHLQNPLNMTRMIRAGVQNGKALVPQNVRVCARAGHHAGVGRSQADHACCNLNRFTGNNLRFRGTCTLRIQLCSFIVSWRSRLQNHRFTASDGWPWLAGVGFRRIRPGIAHQGFDGLKVP